MRSSQKYKLAVARQSLEIAEARLNLARVVYAERGDYQAQWHRDNMDRLVESRRQTVRILEEA